ncbi:MAG: hypothetical protein ACE5GB_11750, partial [Acidimicrobiales bacterium]
MSPGRRGALSVALGLAVALALLPTALDDDTDARSPAGDAVAHDGTRSAGSGTTTTAPPTVETSSTTSSTTTTSTTSPTTTSTSTTTTTTTTTVAASGSGSAPRAGASATSRVELDVTSVGDPVSGADTTLTTTIAATRAGPGAVTVTIDLEGAVAIHAPNGCTHAETTITCSTALGAGDLVELPVLVAVDPAATTITVGARAAVANGVDPSPVTASFPTVAAGPGLSARLTAVGNLDITLVGNTLASCGAGTGIGAVTCESVRAGGALTALVNDTWPMTVVGADDRSTGSS